MAAPNTTTSTHYILNGDSSDGIQIASASTTPIGFYGATPITQRTSSAQTTLTFGIKHTNAYGFTSSAAMTSFKNQLAEICATLKLLGLWKGS